MTRKDRKRYSEEFKREAVRRVNESGKPVTEVARELDVSVHLLYRWRDAADRPKDPAVSPKKSTNGELEVLKRENRRLREERDILKKSLIFFAKEGNKDTNSSGSTDASSE